MSSSVGQSQASSGPDLLTVHAPQPTSIRDITLARISWQEPIPKSRFRGQGPLEAALPQKYRNQQFKVRRYLSS